MTVQTANASAAVLTYAAGFNGDAANQNTATMTGSVIGDNIVLYAKAGIWWILSTRACTISHV